VLEKMIFEMFSRTARRKPEADPGRADHHAAGSWPAVRPAGKLEADPGRADHHAAGSWKPCRVPWVA